MRFTFDVFHWTITSPDNIEVNITTQLTAIKPTEHWPYLGFYLIAGSGTATGIKCDKLQNDMKRFLIPSHGGIIIPPCRDGHYFDFKIKIMI